MSRRAVLGVLLAGGLGAAGVQGTGAFSSVTGDRSFSVGTASDGNALLGVDTKDPEGDSGESVTLMTLTNRFTDPLTLERVSVVSSGQLGIGRSDLDVSTWSLQPGESAEIETVLSCSSGTTDDVELGIQASTSEESIELTRATTVTCRAATPQCLTGTEIELEEETVPCIDVGVRGGGETDVSISLLSATVDGDVTVEIRGGGESEVSISLEGSTVDGDVTVDVRGRGDVEFEREDSTVTGDVNI